tara:strand:- start:2 stop:250 length:249 start_codon:yes stop_codon:yes gene_type:complete
MTMAEFNIRLFSFKRLERNKEVLFREVAWQSLVGSHADPKKIPKNRQKFWQIGEVSKIDKETKDRMKEAMLHAMSNYTKRDK